MKQLKSIILFFVVAFTFFGAAAQDISINAQTAIPGTVTIGGSVFVELQISNNDVTNSLASYKLRPRLTVPNVVTIAASGHILPPGFTIVAQNLQV